MSLTLAKTKTRRGLTLIETLLALGIAAIVIIGAVSFFNSASGTQRANDAKSQLNALVAGVQQSYSAIGDYSQVTTANVINAGFAPSGTVNAARNALINPWRGAYTLAGTANSFTITMTGVPRDGCMSLLSARMPNGTSIQGIKRGTGNTLTGALTPASNASAVQGAASACTDSNNSITIIAR